MKNSEFYESIYQFQVHSPTTKQYWVKIVKLYLDTTATTI